VSPCPVTPTLPLSLHDRPREKLERLGTAALGDNELVAVLIGHGTTRQDALAIANAVVTASGGIVGLTRVTREDLARVPGVGAVIASRILAGVELGRRTLVPTSDPRPRLRAPRDSAAWLLPRYGASPVERFGVMLLDARHRLIRARVLSIGSVDSSYAHPREVFRAALAAGASAVVLFHNHPSGDPTPSEEDLHLTRRLVAAGIVVGVDVVDHLILADMRYCSLKEAGVL
jgi:DNA repair protein RadC